MIQDLPIRNEGGRCFELTAEVDAVLFLKPFDQQHVCRLKIRELPYKVIKQGHLLFAD